MVTVTLTEKAALMKSQSRGGKEVSKESIVRALMKKMNAEATPIKGVNKVHLVFKCPRGHECSKSGASESLMKFQEGTGWVNPYKHLLSCVASGDEEVLLDHYWNAKAASSTTTTTSSKQSKLPFGKTPPKDGPMDGYQIINQREIDMHDWIVMIVMENCPLSCVENVHYRKFAKTQTHFGIKTVRDVILSMTLFVEDVLKAEISAAGNLSIVHDAWSKFGEHYFALFATYKATRTSIVDGVLVSKTAPVISLLSVAPLHTPTTGVMNSDGYLTMLPEEVEMETATEYTAQVHCDHIKHICEQFYNIDWSKVTNQTADNASVNKALARYLEVAHVCCESHLLNSEVKLWMTTNTADIETVGPNTRTYLPGTVVALIHNLMVSVKGSNKNCAVLRNITHLTPKIGCPTRWGSNHNMLTTYERIREAVIEASEDEHSNIDMPPNINSVAFKKAVNNTTLMTADINLISVKMQERMTNLAACDHLQGVLIQMSEQCRLDKDSHWYGNKFGNVYIDPKSDKRPNVAFCSAVKKMQKREGSTLDDEEMAAIKQWMPDKTVPTNNRATPPVTAADFLAQASTGVGGKRKSDDISQGYDDCMDHVIGSAAEVERLWSIARFILTTNRTRMTPVLFEALLFLRAHRELWNENTLKMAIHAVRKEHRDERLNKKIADAGGESDEEDDIGGGLNES